ncbi:hypothetical protein P171DRAFT_44621 [Karstenula rhodostoma CBS 690.94]|uniref:Uncharacterized protein n=1 Tax=Karstenula rhodostoma CBS 690.94 TaxID=1392251 RepID=A0A9P4PH17_9PLEO|nr:hypothetical protein P171DRAFT_44621 [Karstenula rhodostoma CBS 690.94]
MKWVRGCAKVEVASRRGDALPTSSRTMGVLPVVMNRAQAEDLVKNRLSARREQLNECAVRRGAGGSTSGCACCLPLSWLLFATCGSR